MTNNEFLQAYLQLQLGISFDKLIDLDFATVTYAKDSDAPYWNLALVPKMLTDVQLHEIEAVFKDLGRTPVIYFDARNEKLRQMLSSLGYAKDHEDNWLFWPDVSVSTVGFDCVRKVESEDDLAVFVKTFDECYQADDPQNPYGDQSEYLSAIESAWRDFHTTKHEYFVVYDQDKPVAIAALTTENGVGYISSVGSIRAVRGRGFGKIATLYAVNESIKHGNKVHALATEAGHYPNEFYKRIGFESRFFAVAYKKS